jgi:preprotein translocase subunit SecF
MKRKQILVILLVIFIAAFTFLGISNLRNQTHQLKLKDVQLQERGAELKKLELKYKNLNVELDKADQTNKAEVDRLEKEKADLDKERQRLESELQAKLQRKQEQEQIASKLRGSSTGTVAGSQAAPKSVAVSGTCADWLAQAGVPATATVLELIRRESGCNPNAVNPSSGACGIGQQLPCGKWAGAWNDPVAGIIGMNSYVMGRYGSWENALAWHDSHNWY